MISKVLASIFVLVMMGGAMALGSNAVFTDSAALGANSFATGSVDITTSPASALFSVSAMMPGDVTTQPLTVSNSGNAQLRYAISATATNADTKALKDQLVLTVKTVDVTTPGTPCDNFDGTQVYTGDLDGTTGALVGSSAQGAQAGDRVLDASANEVLCFRVSLPLATGNTAQSAATTATFTFDAEQTANN
jgi:hypothetical protein